MEKIINLNYKYKDLKFKENLKDFKSKNLKHLIEMYSIIEKYDLPLEFNDFVEYCYRNSINPRLV